jgi:hypothetical protein
MPEPLWPPRRAAAGRAAAASRRQQAAGSIIPLPLLIIYYARLLQRHIVWDKLGQINGGGWHRVCFFASIQFVASQFRVRHGLPSLTHHIFAS